MFAPAAITVKQKLRRKFLGRLREIWRSSLSAKQKAASTNMWATAVYRYYFPTIRWELIKLSRMDTPVRRNLSKYHAHHKNASFARLYIHHSNGGCGLTSLRHAWEQVVVGMVENLYCQSEFWLKRVLLHNMWRCESLKPNLVQDAMGILSRYDLPLTWEHDAQDNSEQTNHITQQLKFVQKGPVGNGT